MIAGGSALNIVPDRCRFEFEFRPLPGQDPNELFARIRDWAAASLLPAMRAVSPAAAIEWQELMSYPGLGGAVAAPIEQMCSRLAATARGLLVIRQFAHEIAIAGTVLRLPGDLVPAEAMKRAVFAG